LIIPRGTCSLDDVTKRRSMLGICRNLRRVANDPASESGGYRTVINTGMAPVSLFFICTCTSWAGAR
jgi:hypothetical protein